MSDSSDTPDALRATEKKCEPVRCRPPRRSPSPPPPSSGGFFSSVAATVTSTVSSLVGRRQKRPGRKRCKRAAPRDSPPPSPPPVAPPPVPVPAPDARPPRLPVSCAAPPQPPTPLSELTLGDLSPSSLLAEMPVQCARPPPRTPPHPALLAPLPPPVHVGCRTIAPPPLVPRPILLCVPPVFVPPATLSEPPAAVDASAAKTLYWDQIKVPTPACLGLPSSAVAPLSSLCIAALLDAGVHIRSHPDATPELAAQIEDAMVQFPLLGLADPRPVDEWPEHIFAALSAPDAPRPAINLSVELHASAWRIYDLVTTSRAVDALATPAAVSRAMSRYEVFLGLVHDNPGALLVPALDILTVWYSHLIRTDEYKTYCVARWGAGSASLVDRTGPMIVLDRFGKLLTDDNDNDVAVALAQTAELWAAETGFPYETNLAALFADDAAALPPLAPPSSNLLRTMPVSDVIHDRDWVDELVGMLAPDAAAALAAHDDAYLDSLVVTYHRFLFLAAKYPRDRYVSVALDCDLVWHAHQLFPSRYEQDCLRLLGQPLPHLPWPVHTPAEEADNSATLDSAWRDTFGVPFGTRPTVASD